MNVVDTSAWLAFFAGDSNADVFAQPIEDTENLIIPAICVYEISKVVLRESDEHHLLSILAALQKGHIIDVTAPLATTAAKISLQHRLPMADSLIYATAQQFGATVWTQDIDFNNLPNVHYFPK